MSEEPVEIPLALSWELPKRSLVDQLLSQVNLDKDIKWSSVCGWLDVGVVVSGNTNYLSWLSI